MQVVELQVVQEVQEDQVVVVLQMVLQVRLSLVVVLVVVEELRQQKLDVERLLLEMVLLETMGLLVQQEQPEQMLQYQQRM